MLPTNGQFWIEFVLLVIFPSVSLGLAVWYRQYAIAFSQLPLFFASIWFFLDGATLMALAVIPVVSSLGMLTLLVLKEWPSPNETLVELRKDSPTLLR